MKHVRAIVIAAFVCVLGFSLETDRFARAIHRSGRIVGPSGAVHASGMRVQRLRVAGHGLSYGWSHSPSIGVTAPRLHFPRWTWFAFYGMDAASGRPALRHFSARAPPAL